MLNIFFYEYLKGKKNLNYYRISGVQMSMGQEGPNIIPDKEDKHFNTDFSNILTDIKKWRQKVSRNQRISISSIEFPTWMVRNTHHAPSLADLASNSVYEISVITLPALETAQEVITK